MRLFKINGAISLGLVIIAGIGNFQVSAQNTTIPKLLNYLSENQASVGINHPDNRFNGIWWSEIHNRRNTLLFGSASESSRDANCFVTSMVHNLLAEIYLTNPEFKNLHAVLDASLSAINSFRNNEGFNFFPLKDVSPKLLRSGELEFYPNGMRRASHFSYSKKFILHGFNIYNDADDTALGLYANFLNFKILPENNNDFLPDGDVIAEIFMRHRDINGSGTNLWNWIRGHGKETGAFNTWLPDNADPKIHPLFPHKGGFYMPYGVNDIDCVVNANILGILAAMGIDRGPGIQEAADWIIEMIEKEKCSTCAVYYPSGYILAYTVMKAWQRGAVVLEPAIEPLMQMIINEQHQDGSWSDRMEGNEVQASLNAINSLIVMQSLTNEKLGSAISAGLEFVMSRIRQNETQAWLEGGVVFSAGSLIKRTHVWVSDAYTTALLLQALVGIKSIQIK